MSSFNKWRGRFQISMHQRSKGLFSLGSGSFHVDKEGYYLALVDLLASLLESNTMWVLNFWIRIHIFMNNWQLFKLYLWKNYTLILKFIIEKSRRWSFLWNRNWDLGWIWAGSVTFDAVFFMISWAKKIFSNHCRWWKHFWHRMKLKKIIFFFLKS